VGKVFLKMSFYGTVWQFIEGDQYEKVEYDSILLRKEDCWSSFFSRRFLNHVES